MSKTLLLSLLFSSLCYGQNQGTQSPRRQFVGIREGTLIVNESIPTYIDNIYRSGANQQNVDELARLIDTLAVNRRQQILDWSRANPNHPLSQPSQDGGVRETLGILDKTVREARGTLGVFRNQMAIQEISSTLITQACEMAPQCSRNGTVNDSSMRQFMDKINEVIQRRSPTGTLSTP